MWTCRRRRTDRGVGDTGPHDLIRAPPPVQPLRSLSDSLDLALSTARMGIWHVDLERDVVTTHRGSGPLSGLPLGLRPHSLASFLSLVHPDDRASVHDALARVEVDGTFAAEFRASLPSGATRWVQARGVLVRDEAGRPVGIEGTDQDVTSWRAAERTAHERDERFRALFEGADEGIVVFTADERIVDANPALLRMFGYTRDELLAMRVSELVAPRDRRRVGTEVRRIASGLPHHGEWTDIRRDGTEFPVEVSVRGISDDEIVAFIRDVGARRLDEQRRHDVEVRLATAVHAANVGLWDWDLRDDAVLFSDEFKRQLGYEPHEFTDSFDEWKARVHPDDGPLLIKMLEACLRGPQDSFDVEYRIRHRDGSWRRLLGQATRILDDRGQPIRLVGSSVDLTERSQLQAQLLQSQKLESVGRLAGGVAHDFNNLITIIKTTVDLAIDDDRIAPELRSDLELVRGTADRASELTRQLLAFSRRQILHPETLELGALVDNFRTMMQRMIGDDIRLQMRLADGVGSVRADPGQLEQVLLNLAVNARDAMAGGGTLTIDVRNAEFDAVAAATHPPLRPGPVIVISVSDTGTGMDAEVKARIFEPFFTTKEKGKGTGLGLSTVLGIVQQSGGAVWVDSVIGVGTTFHIALPRVEGDVRTERQPKVATVPRGAETLLVVEDEPELRRVTSRALRRAGYSVLEAGHGAEALRVVAESTLPVDLVVTDLAMPVMGGRRLASLLRDTQPGTRVLFTSGNAKAIDDTVAEEPDEAFMEKPYDLVNLTRRVREMLDAPRRRTRAP